MREDIYIAEEKDVKELYALQLKAFESEAEMIGSRRAGHTGGSLRTLYLHKELR